MVKIKAKSIPKTTKNYTTDDLLMLFCYYYPSYKFHEARKMPLIRVIKMLKIADKEKAKEYFELTKIIASPHSKKGSAIKTLLKEYEERINQ